MPEFAVDTERYHLQTHSNCFQKSRSLLADAGSGSDIAVVADVADSAVAVAAAVDRMTRIGTNRRIVVDYNRSVGGIGRLP